MKRIAFILLGFYCVSTNGQAIDSMERDTRIVDAVVQAYLSNLDANRTIQAIALSTDLDVFKYAEKYPFTTELEHLEIFAINGLRVITPEKALFDYEYTCLYITSQNQEIVFQFVSLFIDPDTQESIYIVSGLEEKVRFQVNDNGTFKVVDE